MLETIRQATQTWLAKVILAVITVPFALWGIESYVRTNPAQDSIAKVGKVDITAAEFNDAVRNQLEQFRRQFQGQVDASIMDNPEMRKSLLEQLIDQKAFAVASEKAGLKISDAALRERIASEAPFQENGQFSAARYQTYLKATGQPEIYFENQLRKEMTSSQFAGSLLNTHFVAKASVDAFVKASEQAREVAMINLAPEAYLSQVKVTPEQAKAEYEKNKVAYTIPEQVRAEYVELSVDSLAPSVAVTPEEIKQFYDTNSTRFVQKEERKASHILIGAAKDAKAEVKAAAKAKAEKIFADAKKAPKDFAELARKFSEDPGSGKAGGDLGFFKRNGQMVKAFEDAVFTAKKDEVVGPVESEFGYHIIVVREIRAEKGKSVAEATPEIEGELKKQKAARKFAEVAEKFANAAYEQSNTLKGASEVAGLPIKQSPWMAKGGGIPPFNNPKLSTALFSDDVLKNKRNTEAVEIGTNVLVAARLLELKPSVVRPFEEVEKGITAKLARDEAGKLARKEGEAKFAALKEGKGADLKWPALLAVSRANPGGLAPNVVEAAMKLETSKLPAYTGVELPGGGYALVQVAKVIDTGASDENKKKQAAQRVAQALSQQEVYSLVAQTRGEIGVTIAKDALTKKDK